MVRQNLSRAILEQIDEAEKAPGKGPSIEILSIQVGSDERYPGSFVTGSVRVDGEDDEFVVMFPPEGMVGERVHVMLRSGSSLTCRKTESPAYHTDENLLKAGEQAVREMMVFRWSMQHSRFRSPFLGGPTK